jgi:hypothetical protein
MIQLETRYQPLWQYRIQGGQKHMMHDNYEPNVIVADSDTPIVSEILIVGALNSFFDPRSNTQFFSSVHFCDLISRQT